ncbi:MAG: flagellar motor protein [Myxococcota bacterium]|nr:flagellar motor protein [Myxococcota bacterium]
MSGSGPKRGLDWMTIIGGIGGTGAILVANKVEGGTVMQLVAPGAFLIVIVGTAMATLLQFTTSEVRKSLNDTRDLLQPEVLDLEETVATVMELAKLARRKGMVAIDREVQNLDDEFMKMAMGMAADGIEPKSLKEALEIQKKTIEHRDEVSASFWEAAGGYSPTIGVLGAVIGLMHVMSHLTDPAKLGAGIAVAFVATIYGVGWANLMLLPMAGKLHRQLHDRLRRLEIIIQGTYSIASGENPMITEQKLNAYLHGPVADRDQDGGGGGGDQKDSEAAA